MASFVQEPTHIRSFLVVRVASSVQQQRRCTLIVCASQFARHSLLRRLSIQGEPIQWPALSEAEIKKDHGGQSMDMGLGLGQGVAKK